MTTHWSMVSDFSLQHSAPDRAEAAFNRLCQDYWAPLYRFVLYRGYSSADAQDLTQGFFAYLCEKQAFPTPDRRKGRFRSFLLMLLKRYLGASDAYRSRQIRGGGKTMVFLDQSRLGESDAAAEQELTIGPPCDEQRHFDRSWAGELVGRAMDALSAEYSGGRKARVFTELRPFLAGGIGLPTHEEAAANLGVSVETLRSHICRLRARYRALLRAEVRRTVPAEQEVDDELRYLCRVLVASS
jgi:DNA-directed RNA polymerase specialized sigma24 family protein